MNGFYQHRNVHKYTWFSQLESSFIDYIEMKQTSKTEKTDIRVYGEAECGFDYFLLSAVCLLYYRKRNETRMEMERVFSGTIR